jgi:hypothetical protein
MYSFRMRAASSALLLAAAVTVTACDDASQTPLQPVEGAATQSAVPANEQLAKLTALALRDASVRALLHRSLAASPLMEQKLFFNGFLREEGAPLLKAMARATGATEAQVLALLDQTGPMEIYLPVDAHRAQWQGGAELLVATLMKDHTVPAGFDLSGQAVALSATEAPAVPTVSIVPVESFDRFGNARERQVPAGHQHALAPRMTHNPYGEMWTGLWINYINIPGDYEGWAKGDPEYEMYLERAADRSRIRCAEATQSVEPFRWNMDGTGYTSDFLIAWEQETPDLTGVIIYVYEDDDDTCTIRDDKDYAKLAADALNNAQSAHKAIMEKQYGTAAMHVYNGFVAVKSIIGTDDEMVGLAASPSNLGTTEQIVLLKNKDMNDTGKLYVQWKTDTAH